MFLFDLIAHIKKTIEEKWVSTAFSITYNVYWSETKTDFVHDEHSAAVVANLFGLWPSKAKRCLLRSLCHSSWEGNSSLEKFLDAWKSVSQKKEKIREKLEKIRFYAEKISFLVNHVITTQICSQAGNRCLQGRFFESGTVLLYLSVHLFLCSSPVYL